jgi:hypothetical protein
MIQLQLTSGFLVVVVPADCDAAGVAATELCAAEAELGEAVVEADAPAPLLAAITRTENKATTSRAPRRRSAGLVRVIIGHSLSKPPVVSRKPPGRARE